MRRLPFALVVAFVTFLPSAARAAAAAGEPLDERSRAAVDRGLTWLAAKWAPGPDAPAAARGDVKEDGKSPVTASLAGLAFVAAGAADAPDGPYAGAYAACLERVLASQQEDGLFSITPSHGPMYHHAFAMLFVAHALAHTPEADGGDAAAMKAALERAVRVSAKAQNPEGGWRYRAEPLDADASVTSANLLALCAAERAGVEVDAQVLDRAGAYLTKLQNEDGGFRYMAEPTTALSGIARSAGATAALQAWGKADKRVNERALEYLVGWVGALEASGGKRPDSQGHLYYRHYYLARALWDAGGEHRDRHLPVCRDFLLSLQRPDGSWDGDFNAEYATAMALIALQVPEGRLSIAGDDGDGPP